MYGRVASLVIQFDGTDIENFSLGKFRLLMLCIDVVARRFKSLLEICCAERGNLSASKSEILPAIARMADAVNKDRMKNW